MQMLQETLCLLISYIQISWWLFEWDTNIYGSYSHTNGKWLDGQRYILRIHMLHWHICHKIENTTTSYPVGWWSCLPLSSTNSTILQPRVAFGIRVHYCVHTQEPNKNIWKTREESQSSTTRSTTKETNIEKITQIPTTEVEGVIRTVNWYYSQQALPIPIMPIFKKIVQESRNQEECTWIMTGR